MHPKKKNLSARIYDNCIISLNDSNILFRLLYTLGSVYIKATNFVAFSNHRITTNSINIRNLSLLHSLFLISTTMGLSQKDRNTSTSSNPNLPNPYNPSSYIYHGPQVRTVKESITSSTNATFLVYQGPNSSILVNQPVFPATTELAQRFRCPSLS